MFKKTLEISINHFEKLLASNKAELKFAQKRLFFKKA